MIPTKLKSRFKKAIRIGRDPWEKLYKKRFRRKKWRIHGYLRRFKRPRLLNVWNTLLRASKPVKRRHFFRDNLHERQTFRYFYGALQGFKLKKVAKKSSNWKIFFETLERRLDVLIYRCHLFPTVSEGRQWINHGHVLVNGRKSFGHRLLKKGDIIELDDVLKKRLRHYLRQFNLGHFRRSRGRKRFPRTHKPFPNWVDIDSQSLRIVVITLPDVAELSFPFRGDPQNVFHFYRR